MNLKILIAAIVAVGPPPIVSQASAQQVRYFIDASNDFDPNSPSATRKTRTQPKLNVNFDRQSVRLITRERPGTIIVDTDAKFLYLIETGGLATRYGVGVGRQGYGWSGTQKVTRKTKWPRWTPPAEMIARERAKGRKLPTYMPGGKDNPLGARALYLGSTLYRIHGTNQPWTIGQDISSGCIRMMNDDVIDLYERVRTGTKVIVIGNGMSRNNTYREG